MRILTFFFCYRLKEARSQTTEPSVLAEIEDSQYIIDQIERNKIAFVGTETQSPIRRWEELKFETLVRRKAREGNVNKQPQKSFQNFPVKSAVAAATATAVRGPKATTTEVNSSRKITIPWLVPNTNWNSSSNVTSPNPSRLQTSSISPNFKMGSTKSSTHIDLTLED